MMRGVILAAVGILFFLLGAASARALGGDYAPSTVGAGAPEVHIRPDGTMSVRSAKVDQVVGTTFFLMTKWGTLPLRWAMKTDEKTRVVKRYGGAAEVSQITLGDYLDADGDFFVGSDFFGLTARAVKDWSLQEEQETFSGTVLEVNPDGTMLLRAAGGNAIRVREATTTSVRKGSVAIPWERIKKGDAVPLADGVYDYPSNTLTARTLVIFQSPAVFSARNYEGVLKARPAPAAPTAFTVSVGGLEYTVHLTEKTEVLKKNRASAELSRFVVGDIVRFYGRLQEEPKLLRDELIVDAEVVRNLNL